MATPNPVESGFPYRVTQINGNLHTIRRRERSVQFKVKRSGLGRCVGYSHVGTIPQFHAYPLLSAYDAKIGLPTSRP